MHANHGPRSSISNSNGTAALNGPSANGSGTVRGSESANFSNGNSNGSLKRSANGNRPSWPTYRGHDRLEMVRLMMQALYDMGFVTAAKALEAESDVQLESPSVAALRYAVLNAQWTDAELLLLGPRPDSNSHLAELHGQGLPLRANVDGNNLRFAIRRQKYLELLEQRDHSSALAVLRHGLTPLRPPAEQLLTLSGLMVCRTADELRSQANWSGAHYGSRQDLLDLLSHSIHHSVIVPPNRLANLLTQTQKVWISNCIWHNPVEPLSLFVDHACDRTQFPLHTMHTLTQNDEVYHVTFSNNGMYLAASGKENCTVLYEVGGEWPVKHRLVGHTDTVAYGAFSPDDTLFLTCGGKCSAKLWDVETGICRATIKNFEAPVTTAAWLPDGSAFVIGSHDNRNPLILWRVDDVLQNNTKPHLIFPVKNLRVQDIAITPDGSKLLVVKAHDREGQLSVLDLTGPNHEEVFRLFFEAATTCVSISRDGRHALLNLADCKLQCIDIESLDIVQRYEGQQQGRNIIRSTFGGADDNLVISGSQDGNVFVFHRDRGTLIETLPGHTKPGFGDSQCANAVAWNPVDACMFASCGDDGLIKIWSKGNARTSHSIRRRSSDLSLEQDGIDRVELPPITGSSWAQLLNSRQGTASTGPSAIL